MEDRPRRSAGMRGDPRNAASEHRPISAVPPTLPQEAKQPERVSTSRFARPKVLMGEVAAPIPKFAASRGGGGVQIGKQRDAFRAFMIARRLRPTEWARAAGVTSGEILAFLTGHVRAIAPATLEKLARAAKCAPDDMFR
jgi:DNA-binding Xre family transcriptional regulator